MNSEHTKLSRSVARPSPDELTLSTRKAVASARAKEINEWQERLIRAEDRIRLTEDDLRFYRAERRAASEALARLRCQQREASRV